MNPQPTHRAPLQRSCQRPFVLLCLALLLGFGSNAHAARRVALLIGNSQYQHETVLPNPVRDVALLERTLVQLGFNVDKAVNLDKRGMELAINRFASKTAGADTALVFYAGHGTQPSKGGRSFLLPVNAQVTDDETLETDGVPADDIASKLERTSNPAKLRLVILDACRSRKTSRGNDRGLAPPKPTDDYTLIAYSTNDGETADDGKGANSPYAQALAKLLPRLTKEPVRQVFEDTAREVRATTNNKQKPRTYGDLESRIGLDGVQVASVGVEGTGRPLQADPDEEAWDLAKRRDTAAAYQAYLNRYPQGRFADTARVALEGLQPATSTPAAPQAPRPTQLPAQQVAQNTQSSSTTQPGQEFQDCQEAHCPKMVVIPAGSFTMGSNEKDNEKPPHTVSVRSFAAGKYAVTKGQFAAFVQARGFRTEAEQGDGCYGWTGTKFEKSTTYNWRNVGFAQGDDHPVVCVSWNDAQAYTQWLSQSTGKAYRLLSEAEREYAARAGTSSKYWWGDTASHDYANYGKDQCCGPLAQGRDQWEFTSPVGQFPANGFGLHDMHGNTWDWVQDVWHDNYAGAPTDGSAWTTGGDASRRVLRGGSWFISPVILRSAYRDGNSPGLRVIGSGFRLARTVP